jgi:tetratricopeptide (TPR) repeat protein
VGVYGRVKGYPFVNLDDTAYVTQNAHVKAGLTWDTFQWAWTANDASNWHPLTWLSHALDVELFGLNPAGHHMVSLAIHVLNVLLLFFLLARVTGAPGRSFLAAALFALHPFNVESVAWVAERKNVLSTLFFLLTLAAYGWYAQKPKATRYLVVVALFALGLTAKPMVITLPFVLLLLDFWPLQRVQGSEAYATGKLSKTQRRKTQPEPVAPTFPFPLPQAPFSRLVLEKLPLLTLCLASAALTIIAQGSAGSIQAFTELLLGLRIENAIYSYAAYLWQAFWPARLCAYYPFPHEGIAAWRLILAVAFLLVVSALVWQQRHTRRYLLAGWLWYLGTLVPVIGVIQVGNQARADRYMYVPLIGIFVMVVWGIADWADRRKIGLPARATAAAALLAVLSFLAFRQTGYWKSSYDLWSHAVGVTSNNFLAEANLADALRALGRSQEALPHFQTAAELNSVDPIIHVDLAVAFADVGRLQDAIDQYKVAIKLSSNRKVQAPSYESLAALYSALGDYPNVQASYKQALAISPGIAPFMIGHLSYSVQNHPTARGYLSLGLLQQAAGHLAEAREAYQQALKLDPTLEPAKTNLDLLSP